jgi:hypothetical protein
MLFALDFFRREAPPGSLVAAMAVGHVGYYDRDLRILDMWGLNDPHIAHVQASPTVKFGHDKMDLGYVLSNKPDYAYILSWTDVPPVPGYDVCWPSAFIPTGIYRRSFPLAPNEASLGVPPGVTRRLAPPPPCLPPGPRTATTSLPQPSPQNPLPRGGT